eukprot:7369593-Alexandrium_andersonii.AAC.1
MWGVRFAPRCPAAAGWAAAIVAALAGRFAGPPPSSGSVLGLRSASFTDRRSWTPTWRGRRCPGGTLRPA